MVRRRVINKGLAAFLKSNNMEQQNAFRSFRTNAVLNVLSKVDKGEDLRYLVIFPSFYEPKMDEEYDESAECEVHESLVNTLEVLKGELNSYRAGMICREILGINLDKTKLLGFVKPKDYSYQLKAREFREVIKANNVALKKLVIVEHHNLKVTRYPYLQGVYYGRERRLGVDFWYVDEQTNIFMEGFCHNL